MIDKVEESHDQFSVGVMVRPVGPTMPAATPDVGSDGPSGFSEAAGGRGRHAANGRGPVAELGERVVRAAADAVASQVAIFTDQVRASLERQRATTTPPGDLDLDGVELTFGITLVGGVGPGISALIKAEGESTFEVTITLSRRSG
jgi:hypothetical protein